VTTMRQFVGEVLRARRLAAGLTLRDVSAKARVSLGYISEIERGQKEPSSELLAALTTALDVPLSQVLLDVSTLLAIEEGTELASISSIAHGTPSIRLSDTVSAA
jgi:transcriptional regulator with XRE-family HTH domain